MAGQINAGSVVPRTVRVHRDRGAGQRAAPLYGQQIASLFALADVARREKGRPLSLVGMWLCGHVA